MRRYKILVIEDEPIIVQLFRINFEMRGFEVLGTDGSKDALQRALEERPDLIILDILMPGKSGWQILEELKSREELSSIPVVICTVMAKDEDYKHGKKLGAAAYITKPFELTELIHVVERTLGIEEE